MKKQVIYKHTALIAKIKTAFICLLLTAPFSRAQTLDSTTAAELTEELITRYLTEYYLNDDNMERKGPCVYGKKEGFTLSCIYVHQEPSWVEDLNGDGIIDMMVRLTDEGLGGGGNAFGFEYDILILNADKTIENVYSLFGGGKMSYAHLSVDSLRKGKIYATYEQNSYAYGFDQKTLDNLKSLSLVFFLEDGKIKEQNYARCPLAAMENKTIFKQDDKYEIKRSLMLDDAYNEEQKERLFLSDGSHYYASLSGCKEIRLYVSHTIPYVSEKQGNSKSIFKTYWLQHIDFLIDHTRYKTLFGQLKKELERLPSEDILIGKYGGASYPFQLYDGWQATVYLSGNEEQGSLITIQATKSDQKTPLSFWEALEQKTKP